MPLSLAQLFSLSKTLSIELHPFSRFNNPPLPICHEIFARITRLKKKGTKERLCGGDVRSGVL